jgi:transposase
MSVLLKDGTVWYFHYDVPVFSHAEEQLASFRMFTASLCDHGQCKLVDISRVFGVSEISVKRAVKQFRTCGPESCFEGRKQAPVRPRVWDDERVQKAQALLDEGLSPREVGERVGIKADTVRRAIGTGRLHRPEKRGSSRRQGSVLPT